MDFIGKIDNSKEIVSAGCPYGQKYDAFEIIPRNAPASSKVKNKFTVKNGDIAITEALTLIKKQMGAEFESKKMRKKIKTIAVQPDVEKLFCYGFEIRGIKA